MATCFLSSAGKIPMDTFSCQKTLLMQPSHYTAILKSQPVLSSIIGYAYAAPLKPVMFIFPLLIFDTLIQDPIF